MTGFQIGPIGIVIIAIYSTAIGGGVLLIGRLLKNFRWRWWVLVPPCLLLMALPWAEEAWIAWHFKEACKEAGVTVYRQVEVEGFYDGTIGTGYSFIEDYGYRFMEEKTSDGKIAHTERPDGHWKTTILDKPSARYQLRYAYRLDNYTIEEPIGWKLEKIERQVIDSQSGEILGRDVLVHRGFPIHEVLLLQLFGTPMLTCPSAQVKPYILPLPFSQAVLKPSTKPR